MPRHDANAKTPATEAKRSKSVDVRRYRSDLRFLCTSIAGAVAPFGDNGRACSPVRRIQLLADA